MTRTDLAQSIWFGKWQTIDFDHSWQFGLHSSLPWHFSPNLAKTAFKRHRPNGSKASEAKAKLQWATATCCDRAGGHTFPLNGTKAILRRRLTNRSEPIQSKPWTMQNARAKWKMLGQKRRKNELKSQRLTAFEFNLLLNLFEWRWRGKEASSISARVWGNNRRDLLSG